MKLVAHNGSRVWGGNEKWLGLVAAGLIARGHQVVVSCRAGGIVAEHLNRSGVPTSAVRPGGDLDVPSVVRFARWLRAEQPDAVLSTSWNRLASVALAARYAGAPRLAVRLGIVRGYPRPGPTRWAIERAVDLVIVNSEEIRKVWLHTAPSAVAERVRLVHNGIEPGASPGSEARNQLRSQLGIGDRDRLLVAAGHVLPRKGFDLLIEAFSRLEGVPAHLAIAGDGPQIPELRELANARGVADRVHWLGFRTDVPHVLAAGDVFVLSSRNEGMANVMLEAMAAEIPVVSTAVSGVQTALGAEDGGPPAGWIVAPDDPAAMAAAVGEVLHGPPQEVRRRVEEATHRIRTRFTTKRMLDEVEGLLFGGRR